MTTKVDFTVPEIPSGEYDPESDELIIFDTEGEPHVIDVPKNDGKSVFPIIIEDAEGNKYQIDLPADTSTSQEGAEENGTDTSGGKQKPIITKVDDLPSGFTPGKYAASEAGFSVRFSKGDGVYAFDSGKEPWYQTAQLIKSYYPQLAEDYVAPWKLIPVGGSDVVEASISGDVADKSTVRFVLKDGSPVPFKEVNGKWQLTLPSVKSGETYEVFAVSEKKKGKVLTVGKLNVVSYPSQTRIVTLVPVGGEQPDVAFIERDLNRLYRPYGISITVKVDDCLKGSTAWDSDGDGALNLNGSGFFSKETDEMKALRKLYQSTSRNYDRNSYYVFLLDRAKAGDEPDAGLAVQGDMPRGKQFGYIFLRNTANTARLIAHELGHGIFTLRHSFDVNYSGDKFKAATSNLMDYNNGEDLAVWQWNVLAHPAPLTWFDSEGDAMSVANDKLQALKHQLESLGEDHVIFALKCVTSTPSDDKSIVVNDYRYYLLKLNTDKDGNISPEILAIEKKKSQEVLKGDWQWTPMGEAFLVQNVKTSGNLLQKLSTLNILDYPDACDLQSPLKIKNFTSQLAKDIQNGKANTAEDALISEVVSSVQKQLNVSFFQDVKLSVRISSSTGLSKTLLTTGLTRTEDAEIAVGINIDPATKKVDVSITPSENYLSAYVSKLQKEADARGIKVNVEELRSQILNDLRSQSRSRSLFDKLTDQLPASVRSLIKDQVATFVEGIQASQKICKNVWDKGEINRSTWYSKEGDHGQWPDYCQFHPVVGGLEDGIIDDIVGIPLAVKGVYDLMTDAEQRVALMQLFSKDGMSQMWASLKDEASGTLGDNERLEHFGSKTVVQTVSFATGGVKVTGSILAAGKAVAAGALPVNVTKLLSKLKTAERYLPARLSSIESFLKQMDSKVLDALSGVPGFDKVVTDMAVNWNKFKGGHFQLKYAEELVAKGKKITFEVSDLSDGYRRIYDIAYDDVIDGVRKKVKFELKNWSGFYPETVKSQFIKDLGNMKDRYRRLERTNKYQNATFVAWM